MRLKPWILAPLIGLAAIALRHPAGAEGPGMPPAEARLGAIPAIQLDPRLDPELVSLRKDHATALRAFYQEQARAKAALRDAQAGERNELKKRHREARAGFLNQKHTQPERAVFFRGERAEMATLSSKQRQERLDLEKKLKDQDRDFHGKQKEEEQSLGERLRRRKDRIAEPVAPKN